MPEDEQPSDADGGRGSLGAEYGPHQERWFTPYHGEWTLDGKLVGCDRCGDVRTMEDAAAAREHWEAHVAADGPSVDGTITWYIDGAIGPGKCRVSSPLSALVCELLDTHHSEQRLPVPRIEVIRELLASGEDWRGMTASPDWSRFDLTEEMYDRVAGDLRAAGLAAPGQDPPWATSVFFRRALVVAHRRSEPVEQVIRGSAMHRDMVWALTELPDLSDNARALIQARKEQALQRRFPTFPNL